MLRVLPILLLLTALTVEARVRTGPPEVGARVSVARAGDESVGAFRPPQATGLDPKRASDLDPQQASDLDPQQASDLDPARRELARLQSALEATEARRGALRRALSDSADRIAALKEEGRRGPPLPELLRESQSLSEQLSALAHEASELRERRDRARSELRSALSGELERMRDALQEAGTVDERRALTQAARELSAERERLWVSTVDREREEARRRVSADAPEVPLADDPEELLEEADLLRDARDRARRRLTAVTARIRELEGQRRLERRLDALERRRALFDDSARSFGGGSSPEAAFSPSGPQADVPNEVRGGSGDSGALAGATGAARPPSGVSERTETAYGDAPGAGPRIRDLPRLRELREQLEREAQRLELRAEELERRALER